MKPVFDAVSNDMPSVNFIKIDADVYKEVGDVYGEYILDIFSTMELLLSSSVMSFRGGWVPHRHFLPW